MNEIYNTAKETSTVFCPCLLLYKFVIEPSFERILLKFAVEPIARPLDIVNAVDVIGGNRGAHQGDTRLFFFCSEFSFYHRLIY